MPKQAKPERRPRKGESAEYVEPEVFSDMLKTEHGRLRVSLGDFNGVERVDIRHFYVDKKDNGKLKPTAKGISIPLDKLEVFLRKVKRIGNAE